MVQITYRPRIVWRLPAAASMGLLVACAVGVDDAQVPHSSQTSQATESRAGCQPDTLLLPVRETTDSSSATAINDRGWVVGWLSDEGAKRAVLWRDNGPPLGLGRGTPVDVNEDGVVAINDIGGPAAAGLWEDGTLRKLHGTQSRPHVTVSALNNNGLAVGSISGNRATARAAVWTTNGKLRVLDNPSRKRIGYIAWDVNNRGLIVGYAISDLEAGAEGRALWWRKGALAGVLATASGGRVAAARHVDDRGRLVGFFAPRQADAPAGSIVKWSSVLSHPVKHPDWAAINALHPVGGHLVGAVGKGWAAIGRITDMKATRLPDPRIALEDSNEYTAPSLPTWEALDIATGRSPFAPEGGVTVVGSALHTDSLYDGGGSAVLWTCAQNYNGERRPSKRLDAARG